MRLGPAALAGMLLAGAAAGEEPFGRFAAGVEYTESGLARAHTGTGAAWAKTRLEAFAWGAVEPAPPSGGVHRYDFSCTDALVSEYQEAGMTRLVSYLSPKSSWASVSPGGNIMPKPGLLDDYADFVRALAERYDGDGVADMPGLVAPVHLWVVGGEWSGFWPGGNADDYLTLLAATRGALLAADGAARIGLIPFLLFDVFEGDPTAQEIAARLADPPPAWRDSTAGMLKILSRTELYDFVDLHSLGDASELPPMLAWTRARLAERGVTRPILLDDAWPQGYLANVSWPAIFPVSPDRYEAARRALLRVADGDPQALAWIEAESAAGTIRKVATAAGEGAAGVMIGNTEDWLDDASVPLRELAIGILGADARMGMVDAAHPNGADFCDRRVPGSARLAWDALRLLLDAIDGFDSAERLGGLGAGVVAYRFSRRGETAIVAWHEDGVLQLPGESETPVEVALPLEGAPGAGIVRPPLARGAPPAIAEVATDGGRVRLSLTSAPAIVVPLAAAELFVPIVLSSAGKSGSFFTSELTLANRGLTPGEVELTYVAAFGGGGGADHPVHDVLAPGEQKTLPDALAYLRALGVPLPATGDRGGTLRIRFGGLSSPRAGAVSVRTATALPTGRAGLAYAGIPREELLGGGAAIWGLRQDAADRANLALANAGTAADGDVVLRVTLSSGDPASPRSATLPDVTLAPGGFFQLSGVLELAGVSSGWARVERVSGSAPWTAYGVVNDQVTSDGSFIPPSPDREDAGAVALAVPAVVETASFVTELVLGNAAGVDRALRLTLVAAAIPGGAATATVTLRAGEQRLVRSAVQLLRDAGNAIPSGVTIAGALFVEGADLAGVFAGARTTTTGTGGKFGVFYPAVAGFDASDVLTLTGLLQDASNRSNLAVVDLASGGAFRVEVLDARGVVAGATEIRLAARQWLQLDGALARLAPGVAAGSARVTRVEGSGPFYAYAVVNDGARPGERTGDGAFLAPAR